MTVLAFKIQDKMIFKDFLLYLYEIAGTSQQKVNFHPWIKICSIFDTDLLDKEKEISKPTT